MLLNSQEITEEIKKELKIYLETNYNKNRSLMHLYIQAPLLYDLYTS